MTMDPMLVRAGDTLVVCFAERQSEAATDAFAERVKAHLPGVKVAIVEGVSALAVFRPGDAAQSASEGVVSA